MSFPFCFLQILCLAEQVQFTDRCEAAIKSNSLQEFQIEMESQLESYTNAEIGGGDSPDSESHVLELKLKALILDTIHAIDVVQLLIKHGVKSTDDWMWQKQLRFYMQKSMYLVFDDCVGLYLAKHARYQASFLLASSMNISRLVLLFTCNSSDSRSHISLSPCQFKHGVNPHIEAEVSIINTNGRPRDAFNWFTPQTRRHELRSEHPARFLLKKVFLFQGSSVGSVIIADNEIERFKQHYV